MLVNTYALHYYWTLTFVNPWDPLSLTKIKSWNVEMVNSWRVEKEWLGYNNSECARYIQTLIYNLIICVISLAEDMMESSYHLRCLWLRRESCNYTKNSRCSTQYLQLDLHQMLVLWLFLSGFICWWCTYLPIYRSTGPNAYVPLLLVLHHLLTNLHSTNVPKLTCSSSLEVWVHTLPHVGS